MKIFSERLKNERKLKGYSQEKFASILGLSRSTYSHYEKDGVEPPFELVCKIAKILDVSIDYLFGMQD